MQILCIYFLCCVPSQWREGFDMLKIPNSYDCFRIRCVALCCFS